MTNDHGAGQSKGFAVASLILGIVGLPTVGILGVGALAGIVLGVVGLVKANRAPDEYGGKGLAITGIVLSAISVLVAPFVIGIVAAIAIPSLLRARVSANETTAIADVRTVISAEAAYQASSGGSYGTIECLVRPGECLPRYAGPSLLEARLASGQPERGYLRTFHPGPATGEDAGGTRSGFSSYAYTAVPVTHGQTGVRSFCGDATGRLCYTTDGSAPDVSGGNCPPEWSDLP
jgi:type IV pilus assembly protein PilA